MQDNEIKMTFEVPKVWREAFIELAEQERRTQKAVFMVYFEEIFKQKGIKYE